ncbi:MAG: shikimate kinase [Bdellovibrionota bacterium]
MITLIIGHRGSGKTALLKRIEQYSKTSLEPVVLIDLDMAIEKREGMSITEIFSVKGEQYFRKIEKKYLADIVAEYSKQDKRVFVAAGAGYEGPPPPNTHCLWVRRTTDSLGRIFLDKPRLESAITPREEYFKRHAEREPKYRKWADDVLFVPEGTDGPSIYEQNYFTSGINNIGGTLTLLPEHFKTLKNKISWGVKFFEIRSDLLTDEQIKTAIALIPPEKIILSFRRHIDHLGSNDSLPENILWDWPLEFGPTPSGKTPPIVSLHEREPHESISACLKKFNAVIGRQHLKLAIHINDFSELYEAHQWWMEVPAQRSFLPCSDNSRWAWYRLLMRQKMFLNFFREGDGTAKDQPVLLDWLRMSDLSAHAFAAVLGDPIIHSHTPIEHGDFFSSRGIPVFAIRVSAHEWQEGAINILKKLGLRYAAITSPLKKLAYQICNKTDAQTVSLQSVNTLYWDNEAWHGTNTDIAGLQILTEDLRAHYRPEQIAVWGGGGTLNTLLKTLPEASFYSARTGEPRNDGRMNIKPHAVIWAAGLAGKDTPFPPSEWKPKVVLDLNYSDDSPGKEYALMVGAHHISGLKMFKVQAEKQRIFWAKKNER